jgi:peptidoglycan hydrolase-like protein with peptidoglycan-binding domain
MTIYTDKDTITKVQTLLKEKGYTDISEVDGKLGDITKDVILAFRRRNRMPLTDQIDDDLLMFLPSAPTKVVPLRVMTADAEHLETRVSAVSSTIQAKAASWWQKFWAWLTAIPAGVFTLLTLMLGNVQQAIETVQPLRNFLTEVPVWVWGGGVFAVALVLALNARKISQQVEKTEDALVTGYREGTVKNDKDVTSQPDIPYNPPTS